MNRFLRERLHPPVIGAAGETYKYRMLAPYRIGVASIPGWGIAVLRLLSVDVDGIMTLEQGYSWDGASGPAIDTPTFMRGSAVHDALYQLMRLGYLPRTARKAADMMLRKICRDDGMNRIRAWWVYRSVRLFSGRYAKGGRR